MNFQKRSGVDLETIVSDSGTSTTMSLLELSVPNQMEWKVLSIWVQFITASSGGGSARQLRLRLMNTTAATDAFIDVAPSQTQSSGLTYYYNFFPGAADTVLFDTDAVMCPMPSITLGPGQIIQVEDVSSADTDDDLMELKALVEKFRTLSTT